MAASFDLSLPLAFLSFDASLKRTGSIAPPPPPFAAAAPRRRRSRRIPQAELRWYICFPTLVAGFGSFTLLPLVSELCCSPRSSLSLLGCGCGCSALCIRSVLLLADWREALSIVLFFMLLKF